MTRKRIHELTDLVLDFNEAMKPQAIAFFDFNEVPRIAIYFEYGIGGYGHIEEYNETGYDFDHGERYVDAHMLGDVDIDLVRAEARLKELMGRKDGAAG